LSVAAGRIPALRDRFGLAILVGALSLADFELLANLVGLVALALSFARVADPTCLFFAIRAPELFGVLAKCRCSRRHEALQRNLAVILSHNPCFVITNYHLVKASLYGRRPSAAWEMHSYKSIQNLRLARLKSDRARYILDAALPLGPLQRKIVEMTPSHQKTKAEAHIEDLQQRAQREHTKPDRLGKRIREAQAKSARQTRSG
jgi:hypothetical protein